MFDYRKMLGCDRQNAAGPPAIARFKRWAPRAFLLRFAPVWVVFLVLGSLLPGNVKVTLGTTTLEQQIHPNKNVTVRHRIVHLTLFSFTASLFLLLARTSRAEWRSVVLVMLLGAAVEFAQHWIYQFTFEWWDVRDDCMGVLGVYLVCLIMHRMCGTSSVLYQRFL